MNAARRSRAGQFVGAHATDVHRAVHRGHLVDITDKLGQRRRHRIRAWDNVIAFGNRARDIQRVCFKAKLHGKQIFFDAFGLHKRDNPRCGPQRNRQ